MPFTRIKTIKGKPYRYEITTYRDPDTGKVRQKSRYLGKVGRSEGECESGEWKYRDRILYQGKPGRYLGEVSADPDLLYCKFDDGTWGTPPRSQVSRYPVPGEAAQPTLTLYGEPCLVSGVVAVSDQPVGTVAVEWSFGELKGVVQVPVGRLTPPTLAGHGKDPSRVQLRLW